MMALWLLVLRGSLDLGGPVSACLARARNAVRLCRGGDRRLPAHRGAELDRHPHPVRPAARRAVPAVAGGAAGLSDSGAAAAAWSRLIDLAFLPVLAIVLALPVLKARQLHNYPFPIMLLVLAAANALVHAGSLEWIASAAAWACIWPPTSSSR
jgi:hypothetical protein